MPGTSAVVIVLIMLGLILAGAAGLCGAAFSLSYKVRNRRGYPIGPVMLVFSVFYTLVAGIAALVLGEPLVTASGGLLGLLMGLFLYAAVRAYFVVVARAALNISWLVIQYSVVIPFALSVLIYGDKLGRGAALGVGLVFVSIFCFGLAKGSPVSVRSTADAWVTLLLFLSSLLSGLSASVPRVYAAMEPAGNTFTLLFCQGVTIAALSAIFGGARRGEWAGARPFGTFLGLCTYMSVASGAATAFTILALRHAEGSGVYPVRSVTNLLFVFLLSAVLFHEKIKPLEGVGAAIAVAGIALVSSSLG